jgi:hypothetical protein
MNQMMPAQWEVRHDGNSVLRREYPAIMNHNTVLIEIVEEAVEKMSGSYPIEVEDKKLKVEVERLDTQETYSVECEYSIEVRYDFYTDIKSIEKTNDPTVWKGDHPSQMQLEEIIGTS